MMTELRLQYQRIFTQQLNNFTHAALLSYVYWNFHANFITFPDI